MFTQMQMSLKQPRDVSSRVKWQPQSRDRKQLPQPPSRCEKGTVGFRRATPPPSDLFSSLYPRLSIGAANRLELLGLHLCHPKSFILHRTPGTPASPVTLGLVDFPPQFILPPRGTSSLPFVALDLGPCWQTSIFPGRHR